MWNQEKKIDYVEVDRENEEKGREVKSIQPLIQKRPIGDDSYVCSLKARIIATPAEEQAAGWGSRWRWGNK